MHDPHDPRLLEEEQRRLGGGSYGPDSNGGEMARSFVVFGIIVALVLGGLWLAGA